MIISQTPFRISFFGGGTDYPLWFRENGGMVISTSIDKYCYLTCRHLPPFFNHKHRIVYSVAENVNAIDEIKHPAVRETMRFLEIQEGLEIHHDGDLPARSGMGSSSAFTVGLLNTLYALRGRLVSKKELAEKAIHIEQDLLKETVGSQDQIAAAFGGFNQVLFKHDGSFEVNPIIMAKARRERLQGSLMLYFTGLSRFSSQIAASNLENYEDKKSQLRDIASLAEQGLQVFQNPESDLNEIGRLLDASWKVKRGLSTKVSTNEIDDVYNMAMKSGALGGKLLGAGGGGFLLFFVPAEKQNSVRSALKSIKALIEVGFRFETSGSRIVLYDPDLADQAGRV